MEYLHLNGKYDLVPVNDKGSCMFAALRRGMDVPYEYTNTHMRRQVIMLILKHIEFFYPVFKPSIYGIYGHKRMSEEELSKKELAGDISASDAAEQRMPGPHSMYSYLESMLNPKTWGDEIILTTISMMWQIRITILIGETLIQEKIRHTRSFRNADLSAVLCGSAHYVGAGKFHFVL